MKLIIATFLYFLFVSCTHKGPILLEDGIVTAKAYAPSTRHTETSYHMNYQGELERGTITVGDFEKYMVVFKCSHSVVFSINSKVLYAKLDVEDRVQIAYKEILTNKNKVVDYYFIDANQK